MAAGVPEFPAHRYVVFYGHLNERSSHNLRMHLSNLVRQDTRRVTLLFASGGGTTDDAMALFTHLRSLPYELTTHAVGLVGGMAIPVFLAVDRAHRIASKNASFLFHGYPSRRVQPNGPVAGEMREAPPPVPGDALEWTKKVLRTDTYLTDADFERLKLFDQSVLMDAGKATCAGIVSGICEPAIPDGCQPLIVV
jgi:Clp protease